MTIDIIDFVILGQSVVVVVCKTIDDEIAVQDIDYLMLIETLLENNQLLNLHFKFK